MTVRPWNAKQTRNQGGVLTDVLVLELGEMREVNAL